MSWFHIGPINSAMFILSFRNQDPITFHGQSTAHPGNVLALLDFFFGCCWWYFPTRNL